MTKRLALALALAATPAVAHDPSTATSPEQARVYKMYAGWMRPASIFGIGHRSMGCCNMTDCSPVLESKPDPNGKPGFWIRVEMEPLNWYFVNNETMESNQPDPVESPDGRPHACIIAGIVACYTAGGGT